MAIRLILPAAIKGAERGKNTAGGWRGVILMVEEWSDAWPSRLIVTERSFELPQQPLYAYAYYVSLVRIISWLNLLRQVRAQSSLAIIRAFNGIRLKRNLIRSESVLWHLRVAEGDRLSERSEGRKLPQHRTRALARLR